MTPDQILRLALERLHGVCQARACETDGDRPTDGEYQRAMAAAEAALRETA